MKQVQEEIQIEKEFHVSFYIILYKFLFGLAELLSGLGILFFGKRILGRFTVMITQELLEDPHDMLANLSTKIVPNLLTHNTFLTLYLIILGSAKIAGAIGLIYKRNWGVDLLVGLTVLMFPFQFIDLVIHPSIFDFFYITIGILIALYLIEFKPKAWISRILLGKFGNH
jgi:uncharacterized membrane protein